MKLNKKQIEVKKKVLKCISDGPINHCPVCYSCSYERVYNEDRHGLPINLVYCQDCGLLQLNPRPSERKYNMFYKEFYRDLYSGRKGPDEGDFKEQYKRGKRIYEFLGNPVGKTILEVGTGCGGILKYFKDKGNKVIGLDLGKEYLELGKKKGLDLRLGTLKTFYDKVDIIIYSHVLEHIDAPIEEVKRAKVLLNHGGVLYVEVPGIDKELDVVTFKESIQLAHIYYFDLSSLRLLLNEAGFKLIKGNEEIYSSWKLGTEESDFGSKHTRDIIEEILHREPNLKTKLSFFYNPMISKLRNNSLISKIFYKFK